MWIPPFRLHRPKTLDEACRMAADLDPAFDFIAGGTDLLQNYKCRINVPAEVISLRHIAELQKFGSEKIGSGVLLDVLSKDLKVKQAQSSLAQTCEQVASPLILNSATIGGNLLQDTRCYHFNQSYWWRMAHGSCLKAESDICRVVPNPGNICYATYCGDIAPLLIALEAAVLLQSKEGEREVKLADFYQMDGIRRFDKKKAEILTAIRIPKTAGRFLSGYKKLRVRESIDYPEVGVAIALKLDGDRIEALRIVATAIAPIPVQYHESINRFVGKPLTDPLIEEIAQAVESNSFPYRNTYLVPKYRAKMAGVLAKRILNELRNPQSVSALS